MVRKWEIRTWSHQRPQKQLCEEKLFKKVLFLKVGQKVGNTAPAYTAHVAKQALLMSSVVPELREPTYS